MKINNEDKYFIGVIIVILTALMFLVFGCEMPAIDVSCEDPNVNLELVIEEVVIEDE